MSAQFTPGPWKVSHDEYAGHYDVSTFDPECGSEAIAQVLYANNEPGGRGEADARLIAAAPALLEALEDARTSLSITRTNIMCEIGRCADPSESRWEGVPEQLAKRIAKIDAAISLARGESK